MVFIVTSLAGIVGYVWVTGGSGKASIPISAPLLNHSSELNAERLYRIDPSLSKVRFQVGEVLDSEEQVVIGETNEVTGDMVIDFADPIASRLGVVRINVRTLKTDDAKRDRAIRSFILESGQDRYEFAEFSPLEFINMPDTIAFGDTLKFQIQGLLILKEIPVEVLFDAQVTIGAQEISGVAGGAVRHTDFGLFIPNARGRVTHVEEVVWLEIEFSAPVVVS
jgi:polyisoprenoid-binding protein YceI